MNRVAVLPSGAIKYPFPFVMYVSTLQDFFRAVGGELKITARFPEGTVEIRQFEDVRKSAGDD